MLTKLIALVVLVVIVAAVVFAYNFTASQVDVYPKVAGTNATTPAVGASNNLTYVAVYNNSYVGVYNDSIFIVTG